MTQYIQLIQEAYFDDTSGRQTCLKTNTFGYILNEDEIAKLQGATREIKEFLQKQRIDVEAQGHTYALIEGYPCGLISKQYRLLCPIFDGIPPCIKELILL